ncbi:hypothetical protein ACH5RR_011701 [Cinchona calisaya]|uniref:Uncharacterized protein n=1 Tax=Cinchona calisaya TaxID=153742 RepID=A0ABD3A5M6_9GENT
MKAGALADNPCYRQFHEDMVASILFLVLQKPWKGRPLTNAQVVPSVINGVITALYFILWGKGLKSCGPLRAILAEYSGAVLGVLSAVLYGRRSHVWKKWMHSGQLNHRVPFSDSPDIEVKSDQVLGMNEMLVPIIAGVLSAFRRGSTSVELPFSAWAFSSTIFFGVMLIFYVDSIAEERLHMVFSSPRHLMVAGACIIVMEIMYNMDFSLLGFLICAVFLGFGIYEATSLDRVLKDSLQKSVTSNGIFEDQIEMSALPT